MNIKIKRCKFTKLYYVSCYDDSTHKYIHLDFKFYKKYKDVKDHYYAILRRLQETGE